MSSAVRIKLRAPDRKTLKRLVHQKRYDVVRGSFRVGPEGASIDAWLPADDPEALAALASQSAGVGPEGVAAAPDVVRVELPPPDIGRGDRFASGSVPRGFGHKR